MPNPVLNRRLTGGEVRGDFSAGLTGTSVLSAANTAGRFNPANSVALTCAFFVYPLQLTAATYYTYVRVASGTVGNDAWGIQRDGSNTFFSIFYSNGAAYFSVAAIAPSVNTWYMVMGTWFNTGATPTLEIRVYGPSGSLTDTTNTGVGFINTASTAPLTIGASGGLTAQARIDKVGLWNRAFSGAEATALWNGGAGLRGQDIVGAGLGTSWIYWWDLDEGTGKPTWPGFLGGAPLTATGVVTRQPRAGT